VLLVGLAALSSALYAQDPQPVDPASLSPVQVLLRMKRTYSRCRSYRDRGVVKTVSVGEDTRFGSEVPFSTAFVRPGPLRFEFVDRGLGERSSRAILWWNGAEVHSWWDAQPGERLGESLQQALDAASGISAGASLRIPGMLLPAVVGAGAPLIEPERLADEVEGDRPCFRLVGKGRATPYTETSGPISVTVNDEKATLWIDRETYLLRKVEEVKSMSSYRQTRTTTYTPEIDVEIPAGELELNAPAAAQATSLRPISSAGAG